MFVAKYDADGQNVDWDYGVDGVVNVPRPAGYTNIKLVDAALQVDGKLVGVAIAYNGAAPANAMVIRLNTDGTLDTTFNGTGTLIYSYSTNNSINEQDLPSAVATTPDGKILIAASSDFSQTTAVVWNATITKLNANGSFDATFNNYAAGRSTLHTGDGKDVVLAPDGTIYGVGRDGSTSYVVKILANGKRDTTFGSSGRLATNFGDATTRLQAGAIQSDNKLVVSGYRASKAFLARFNTSGANPLDLTFGSGVGYQMYDSPVPEDVLYDVAITPTGEIVGTGYGSNVNNIPTRDVLTLRTDGAGTLDTTVGVNGFATYNAASDSDYASKISLQQDGKFLLSTVTTVAAVPQCTAVRLLP